MCIVMYLVCNIHWQEVIGLVQICCVHWQQDDHTLPFHRWIDTRHGIALFILDWKLLLIIHSNDWFNVFLGVYSVCCSKWHKVFCRYTHTHILVQSHCSVPPTGMQEELGLLFVLYCCRGVLSSLRLSGRWWIHITSVCPDGITTFILCQQISSPSLQWTIYNSYSSWDSHLVSFNEHWNAQCCVAQDPFFPQN